MFSERVKAIEADLIRVRRHLHEYPELPFEEAGTTAFIAKELEGLENVTLSFPTKTGLVATLKGRREGTGRVIAFRADIDALPIQEETGLSFASKVPGVMHACGHDGHAAMQLEAVKLLDGEADQLCGEVRFLFQHAEEKPPGGAVQMFDAGVMSGVCELYGMHLSSSYDTGTFGIRPGALTSATDRFEIRISGTEGHSAFPEQCIDPVVTAAQVILGLQTIVSRRVAAAEPIVVSVCEVKAGNVYNVIPQEVIITGATRTFSEKTRRELPEMMKQITGGICAASGASFTLDFQKGYASVINDPVLTAQSRSRVESIFGKEAAFDIGPLMPGEDFSALQRDCPAFFVELGARSEKKGCTVPHHNRCYLMDEDALLYGVEYIYRTVKERLG